MQRLRAMAGFTLVVDDDEVHAQMLVVGLSAEGWAASAATGAREALERLEQNPFTLVVSDIGMHDGDGFELLRAIQTAARPVPVILMSSFGTSATSREAIDAGAFAYLAKPFALSELIALVSRAHAPAAWS